MTTKRHQLTDRERAALLMLHYGCNGAATAMCGGSAVLASVNAALSAIVQGDLAHAAEVLRLCDAALSAEDHD